MIRRTLTTLVAILALGTPVAAQTGTVMPAPKFTATLNTGAPCAGCKLTTYAAGTTTPLSTYSNSSLTTPNTNPVILDASGRATVYLSPTSYRFDLFTAADVLIWSVDNVRSISPFANLDLAGTAGESLAAGDVVYLSDGAGALTAGRWYKADADTTYSSSLAVMVGMVPSAIASGASGTIRLAGSLTMPSASLLTGTAYYASATAGALTSTAPAFARLVGIADTTQTILLRLQYTQETPALVQATTLTGPQNDFALTANATVLRATNATLLTLTGLAAGYSGQRLEVVAAGAGQIDLANQNVSSVAANRLINGVTGTVSLAAGVGRATLLYDATDARWRVVAHQQGAWITRTFAAGNYTASGALTWTVAAGDVLTDRYLLYGRTLSYAYEVFQSTTGGVAATDLQIAIPGSFVAAARFTNANQVIDNTASQSGVALTTAASATVIAIRQADGGTWSAASTDNTGAAGLIVIEVQ